MFIWWSTHYTSCTFWLTLKLLNLSNDNQIISILSGLSTPCQKEVMAFFWSFRNASGEPGSIRSHLSEPQNPAASKLAWPWPPHGRYDDSRRGGCRGQIDPKSGGFCSKPRWLGHVGSLWTFEWLRGGLKIWCFYPTLKIEMIESRLGARRPLAIRCLKARICWFQEKADSGVSQLRTHSCCDASPSAGSSAAHGTVRQLWSQHSETACFSTWISWMLFWGLTQAEARNFIWEASSQQCAMTLLPKNFLWPRRKTFVYVCVCVCFSACKPVWMC